MKTQIELARDGIISKQMQQVAHDEGYTPETIRSLVAKGEIVIPNNPLTKKMRQQSEQSHKVVGIGTGLRTKVNASIGTSSDICSIDDEIRKALAAQEYPHAKRKPAQCAEISVP
jgi:phosphomethylpyrimidine synthase